MDHFRKKSFAIVDVETSGASHVSDRIIEIAVIRIENGEIVETFSSLVNPQIPISPFIERVTGIKTLDLSGAPFFEEISHKVGELLNEAVFVAHSARFDYGFVKNELKRCGINFNAKCLCSVKLSRRLYPKYRRHDLSSIVDRFSYECSNRHRAYDDAKVVLDFLVDNYKNKKVKLNESIELLLSENTLPPFLSSEEVKKLPEHPGIYMFYGNDNELLYIGKSKNIRYRVLSHFSNDHRSTKELRLCEQTVRVEGIETAGELSALLLESKLIKELSPIYNRMLRRRSQLVLAKKTKSGIYSSVILERTNEIKPEDYKNVLGVFRNLTQGKAYLRSLTAYKLCPRVLGLEKGKGACFNHQIEKCSGACVEKDDPKDFDARFKEAFKHRKLKTWPFSGPILVTERKDDEHMHSFILDNWCLVSDIEISPDDVRPKNHIKKFDYDSYKIFRRYLKNPLNKKKIKVLNKRELKQVNRETENSDKYVYID